MSDAEAAVLVVGGGPAGLRAAEVASAAGAAVILCDAQPSVGRKFLVAGRGGLNLTHSEPVEKFPQRYGAEQERWADLLAEFGPPQLQAWADALGQYLVSKGISAQRISTGGDGATRPRVVVAPGVRERLNRRVNLTLGEKTRGW